MFPKLTLKLSQCFLKKDQFILKFQKFVQRSILRKTGKRAITNPEWFSFIALNRFLKLTMTSLIGLL